MRLASLICLASIALPAVAQDGRPIPVEEWRDRALGNSVRYFIGETYIGREFYLPDGRSVRYEAADGQCQEGLWTHKDGTYCFFWPNGPVCAAHIDLGDGLIEFPTVDGDGNLVPDDTQFGELVEGGFSCAPMVIG
ncbi:hypothetical protein [Roseobacter sp. HKCCA0434]|uniref:hypothetical protein n=1 Tax=Roseobacter sp. HKCCA0434 TaxID=3079297 RepID=UPI002905C28C|nr:hypothetical protein [Roseobacter sp. HKCCA0434]